LIWINADGSARAVPYRPSTMWRYRWPSRVVTYSTKALRWRARQARSRCRQSCGHRPKLHKSW
jgi:hypothetical protein